MPTLTIDNQNITVEPGTTIIEAAKQLGIDVPHFCYHPHLSISGNCRMCLVEVEKMPKPQISCSLVASEGMVVKTQSENAQKWRKNVLEFILVNHPLDCPVCDQAGECKLQNYYFDHSVKGSQFKEQKVHKPKKFRLGPHVMLDDERCIMCSRCIRFCDEISKSSELGFIQRGDHTELRPFPGKQLDNPYSLNTVDICPVGALTNEDFRFKCRVWFLESAPSVCNGCSRGCNINFQSSKGTAYRYLPRENKEVNQVWLCDEGRLSYKAINENRALHVEKRNNTSQFSPINADKALQEIADAIAKLGKDSVAVVGNALSSNENNQALKKWAHELMPNAPLFFSKREASNPYSDEILIKADKNPNTQGVLKLGFQALAPHSAKVWILLEELSEKDLKILSAKRPELIIAFTSHQGATASFADYILPITSFAEEIGTFTNFEGRIQKFTSALKPKGEMKPAWQWLKALATKLGQTWNIQTAEDLLKEGFGLSYAELALNGKLI